MPVQDEATLIKAAVHGDTRALSLLLQHNYAFLFQYALKLTMDRHRAEDISQETMLRAIERIDTFQMKSKFSSWLIAIASRLVIDGARRSKRERKWLEAEQSLRAIRYETMLRMNEWPEALQALGQLEEHIRMPVLLKYYYGYSQEEIAEMLSIRTGTVKSRLHAGMQRLRKELTEEHERL